MPDSLFDALKPYLWLTLAAFLAGFLSYVAVGGGVAAPDGVQIDYAPAASAPASDIWNTPKHI